MSEHQDTPPWGQQVLYPVKTREEADTWKQALLAADLTAGEKVTGFALAAHLNFSTLQLNPSVQRLADVTVQCPRSVEKQLSKLKNKGFTSWDRKKGFGGSNRYSLLIPNSQRELMDRAEALWGRKRKSEPPAENDIDQARTARRPKANGQPHRLRTFGGTNPLVNPRKNFDEPCSYENLTILSPLKSLLSEKDFQGFVRNYFESQNASFAAGPPVTITLDSELWAEYLRNRHKEKFSVAFPKGWKIVSRE